MSRDVFKTRVCAKCGQVFILAPFHIFKEGSKYYCKYTCYTHRNDGKASDDKPKGAEK